MMTTSLLWSIILLYSFHFAGHLHNIVANVPNWSSGTTEDMQRYARFYHKGNNTHYFAPVIFASIIACAVTLAVIWNNGAAVRYLVGTDLLIAVGTLLSVLTLFRPMNLYFESKEYEPQKLKMYVNRWLLFNKIRSVFILAGLVVSIIAFYACKPQ